MTPSNVTYVPLYRLSKYQAFKTFSKRILCSTDLFGRGIDIERVNIVFNYDMPENSDTYLHRVCVLHCTVLCVFDEQKQTEITDRN